MSNGALIDAPAWWQDHPAHPGCAARRAAERRGDQRPRADLRAGNAPLTRSQRTGRARRQFGIGESVILALARGSPEARRNQPPRGWQSDTPACPLACAQVQWVQGASLLVSPHGAHLTNALWMPQGAVLLEVMPWGMWGERGPTPTNYFPPSPQRATLPATPVGGAPVVRASPPNPPAADAVRRLLGLPGSLQWKWPRTRAVAFPAAATESLALEHERERDPGVPRSSFAHQPTSGFSLPLESHHRPARSPCACLARPQTLSERQCSQIEPCRLHYRAHSMLYVSRGGLCKALRKHFAAASRSGSICFKDRGAPHANASLAALPPPSRRTLSRPVVSRLRYWSPGAKPSRTGGEIAGEPGG